VFQGEFVFAPALGRHASPVVTGAVLQENQANRARGGRLLKIKSKIMAVVLSISALACFGLSARAEDAHEDLSACPGSAPEPSQTATWSVAFCNRTSHDLVIEFHENDCPANDWSRRGDVYQRTLKRGESRTLPLCYASEPPGKKPPPGAPTLHLRGGKGVTTTWNVVGDCGDHSKPLNMDARSFYDRGDYKTGIILLQSPSSASHCTSDVAASAAVATPSITMAAPPVSTQAAAAVQPPVAPHSTLALPPAAPVAPAVPRTGGEPTLTASVDKSGLIQHSVLVYAKGGAGYRCNMSLLVTFSDGSTWYDKPKVDITGNDEQLPITTRKYLKSPTDVKITSNKCAPM
jgi:hypothetical protein